MVLNRLKSWQSIITVLQKMPDYKYYNRNPENFNMNDCVCRAISTVSGLSYETTNRLLTRIAKKYDCDKLYCSCYSHLLTHVFGYEKYICKTDKTIADVIHDFPNNKLIIRIKGHLTAAIKGKIYDTWDCSDKLVDCFWIAR